MLRPPSNAGTRFSRLGILLTLPVCLATVTWAQERPGVNPLGRSGLPSLPTLEEEPAKPPAGPILPPLPPAIPEERQRLPQQVRILVRQIRVLGNTVFPLEKLDEVTKPYVNRELTTEELEALRLDLTRLYINAGYINSGAVIPDQTVDDGVITFQIIEGSAHGHRGLRHQVVSRELYSEASGPGRGPTVEYPVLARALAILTTRRTYCPARCRT
jgi:hemolysin activation/secretion protein